MSKFTQQHYETVAEIVYETEKSFGTWQSRSAIDSIFAMLRKKFVSEFRWDNENFKEDLFRRASTFKSGQSDAEISASTAVANVNKTAHHRTGKSFKASVDFGALRHD